MPGSAPEAPPASLALLAGQRIFTEGDPGSTVYFIEAGQLELLKRQGHADVRAALLGSGEVVGEAQALCGGPRSFSAQAVEPTRLLVVEGDTLLALLTARPDVALAMLKRLAPRLEAALGARVPAVPAVAGACFVHTESGREFPLPEGNEVRLGRAEVRSQPGPALDFAGLDPTRSLSRRHARIVRQGGAFEVFEEPRVANGTFLNGARLTPGQRVPLHAGDELRLGAVILSFRAG